MIEEWKVLKEWNKLPQKASTHIKGDKLYISNTGKVRLNDIELTLDRGLYIKNGEIHIVGCSWPYNTMHRTVYTLFVKEPHHDVWHNIHHIDFNHFNNHVDNLVELTVKEHGDIHEGTNTPLYDIDWLNEQERKADKVIEETKEWYRSRVKDYFTNVYEPQLEINKQLRNQRKEDRRKEKEQQLQQEIDRKLESGKYKYNSIGVLIPTTTAKKGYVTPEETKKKQSIGVKKAWDEGRLTADKCCTSRGKERCFNETTKKYFYK